MRVRQNFAYKFIHAVGVPRDLKLEVERWRHLSVGGLGHAPPESFEISRLGNAIFSIFPDIFRRNVDLIKCKMTGVLSA